MSDDGLRALREVRFNWALMEEDVWEPSPFHVDGLHERTKHTIDQAIDDAGQGGRGNPIGIVVEGDKGAGKTHLLGWVREQVQARGGYFFLVGLHEGGSFWDNVLLCHCPMQPPSDILSNCRSHIDEAIACRALHAQCYQLELYTGQCIVQGDNLLAVGELVLNGEINDVGATRRINVPASYRTGVELELDVVPVDWLTLTGNLVASSNKIVNFREYADFYSSDYSYAGNLLAQTYPQTDISFSPDLVTYAQVAVRPLKDLEVAEERMKELIDKEEIDLVFSIPVAVVVASAFFARHCFAPAGLCVSSHSFSNRFLKKLLLHCVGVCVQITSGPPVIASAPTPVP